MFVFCFCEINKKCRNILEIWENLVSNSSIHLFFNVCVSILFSLILMQIMSFSRFSLLTLTLKISSLQRQYYHYEVHSFLKYYFGNFSALFHLLFIIIIIAATHKFELLEKYIVEKKLIHLNRFGVNFPLSHFGYRFILSASSSLPPLLTSLILSAKNNTT